MIERFANISSERVAVSGAFFMLGLTAGFWFVHIPVLADRLALEPSVLGLVLLCLGIGSLIFQPVAGVLLQRVGSKPAVISFQLLGLVLIAAAINAGSALVLATTLFFAGAAVGATNVAINTQGAMAEKLSGKPIMSSFHGFFSLGTFSAAGIGGVVISRGLGDGPGAIGFSLLMAPFVLWIGSKLLGAEASEEDQSDADVAAPKARWTNHLDLPLALLMLLAFIGNAVEFSVNDWSALFLHEIKGVSLAWAASGFAVFSLAMALMRFLGGPLVTRLGVRATLSAGGALVALGMVFVVASPWPAGSVFGFFIVALGLANISPLLISQAALRPGIPSSIGVAAVATGLTAGFLLAPPIIGFVAQLFGLSFAMASMAGVGCAIFLIARLMSWHDLSNGKNT